MCDAVTVSTSSGTADQDLSLCVAMLASMYILAMQESGHYSSVLSVPNSLYLTPDTPNVVSDTGS